MRYAKEIKRDLLEALGSVGDQAFNTMGFNRRKGALKYVRTIGDAKQTIDFLADYVPKYQLGAELHLHPWMDLAMKSVTEMALRLVAGNKLLLANAPEIIVSQPIEFTAPKAEHVRWFASGKNEIEARVIESHRFVQKWVTPFFNELTTPDELIEVYNNADERMMKQRHWYIYIAAAYLVKGDNSAALSVLERNIRATGLRKDYAIAFETLRNSDKP